MKASTRRPLLLAALGAAAATRTAHHRPGAAVASPPLTGLYEPFAARTFELLAESGVTTRAYAVPEGLGVLEGRTGSTPALLTVRAFATEQLRHARLLLLDGGPNLQVLNLCLFPRLDLPLPTFSADLVTLPGGSLIAIDCQPNGVHPPPCAEADAALADAYARETSPEQIVELVLPALEDYLRAYLKLAAATPRISERSDLEAVRSAQLEYARYRTEQDPARPMLSRLFGGKLSERLLREVLFDLPLRIAEQEQG